MSSNTRGGMENGFVTQHNFGCKNFVLISSIWKKIKAKKKHAANLFVSGCCVLQQLAFATSKSLTTSQVVAHCRPPYAPPCDNVACSNCLSLHAINTQTLKLHKKKLCQNKL